MEGLNFMGRVKKYSTIPRLFHIGEEDPVKEIEDQLIEQSCAESQKA